MHALYGDRMYTESIVFSYFKRKHQDWFILKNLIPTLILSFSNQKWWNSLIKSKLKIAFHQKICEPPPIFDSWFLFSSTPHNYGTLFATKGHLKISTDTAASYGKGDFIRMAKKTWNNIQIQIKDLVINTFSPNKLKIFLFDFYVNLYQT